MNEDCYIVVALELNNVLFSHETYVISFFNFVVIFNWIFIFHLSGREAFFVGLLTRDVTLLLNNADESLLWRTILSIIKQKMDNKLSFK